MLQILFITHNSKQVISKAIEGIYGHFPIVIVDNKSTDGSIEELQQKFPKLEIIKLEKNIGYGSAANIVLTKTKYDYVLLLNPDAFISKESVNILLEETKALENCAISGPSLVNEKGTPKEIDWVVGCAMLFNIKLMQKVGFFDEKIFLYGEENDLCYRVKKAGLKMHIIHNAFYEHLNQKSSPTNNEYTYLRKYHKTYSSFYLKKKHKNRFKALRLALGGILKGCIQYFYKNKIEQKARIKASVDFIKNSVYP